MNTSDDIRNPENCRIRRVENGWVLSVGYPEWSGCGPLAEYVFTSQGALGDFIKTKFRLPLKEAKQ